jgi:outer membrane protein
MRVKFLVLLTLFLPLTVGAETSLPLTETELIQKVLEKNLHIQILQAERDMGHADVLSSKSRFDTFLQFDSSYNIDKRDRTTTIFGTTNKLTQFNLGVAKILPSGTLTSVKLLNQRESTNSPFATINPNFDSGLEFSLEQPLLNNFLGQKDRGTITLVKKQIEALNYQTQEKILHETHSVLSHFWNLAISERREKVVKRSVKEAENFLRTTRERKRLGLAQNSDVFAAQANLLEMEKGFLTTQKITQDWQSQLQTDLDLPRETHVTPTHSDKRVIDIPEFEAVMAEALSKRADYKAAQVLLDRENVNVKLKKNSRWPELDLFSTLTLNGVDTRYTHALQESYSADHPNWVIGLKIEVPLENRLARGELSRAKLEKARAVFQAKHLENQIRQEVDVTTRAMQLKLQSLEMTEKILTLQKKKWRSELNRYKIGKSSSDLVIRYHNDYLLAEEGYLQALLEVHLATLDYKRTTNMIFEMGLSS